MGHMLLNTFVAGWCSFSAVVVATNGQPGWAALLGIVAAVNGVFAIGWWRHLRNSRGS